MENLILSFEVVAPLFLLLCVGVLLKRLHMISEKTEKELNNLVFRCFLPLLLFYNVYTTEIYTSFQPHLIRDSRGCMRFSCRRFCVVEQNGMTGAGLLFFLFIVLTVKENSKRGVMIQGMFRSNFVLFGLPVTIALFGEAASGVASIVIGFVVPFINILSVIVLEIFRGGKINGKKILRGIVTNPLVIASLLGAILLLTGLKLPYVVEKAVSDLTKTATPLAFVVLGSSFHFSDTKKYIRLLSTGVIGKLIVYPAMAVGVAILLGFRNEQLAVILAMSASPTAVSSYTMAQQMDGDGPLAGQLVVFTTLFSILTVFLWIFGLKQGGFM